MKKRFMSFVLVLVLALGLAVPAVAAGQTFSDVPESYWGYADIEAVAEAGLMNGTGNGEFSPDLKVSVAQFLTLLGRLVFPDTKVTEGASWYGPYVIAAQLNGLLEGTQVDITNVEAEISRYDMAVILRAAAKKLGVAEKTAQSSEVTDYGMVPTMYADAVLAVYGMGLIRGDQAGNFNGGNTMIRAEVATVIMRLAKAKPGGSTNPGTTTPPEPSAMPEPEKPSQPEGPLEPEIVDMPKDEEMATYTFEVRFQKTDHVLGAPARNTEYDLPNVPVKVYYTPDGGKTSTLVAEGITGEASKVHGGVDWLVLTCECPKSWGLSQSAESGFYYSAETVYEGQRLVTSDLRTDGRAFADIARCSPDSFSSRNIELTPPEGLKIHFTFAGSVVTFAGEKPVPSATVQLYLKDGTLINEAVAGADGRFQMECAVDVLDDALNTAGENYLLTAQGELNGVPLARARNYPSGKPMLYSLNELHINPHYQLTPGEYKVQLH